MIYYSKVDLSDSRLTEITNIKTWLSCAHSCVWVTGVDSVYINPEEFSNQFEIYLEQIRGLLDPTIAADRNYTLHYEVEGNCE